MLGLREYILTEKERHVAQALVEKDLRFNGFRMLRHRALHALPRLEADLSLIKRFLEKAGES